MHLFIFFGHSRPSGVKPMTFRLSGVLLSELYKQAWILHLKYQGKAFKFLGDKTNYYRTAEFLLSLKKLKAVRLCISVVQCAHPVELFMTYTPDTSVYDFNTTVSITCITGYNLTEGSETRTCQHTGDWDGTPPVCTSMYFSYSVLEHSYISSFFIYCLFFRNTHSSHKKNPNNKNWYLFCWQNFSFKPVSAIKQHTIIVCFKIERVLSVNTFLLIQETQITLIKWSKENISYHCVVTTEIIQWKEMCWCENKKCCKL